MRHSGRNKAPPQPATTSEAGAFAGYDTPIPARKGKWGKRILIVILCLLALLALLSLIPTPEAWLE